MGIVPLLLVVMLLAAASLSCMATPTTEPQETEPPRARRGNQQAVQAAGSVLLKDWAPDSSLVVPKSNIPKARFSAIDVHTHLYQADTPEEVAERVRVMDAVGVETVVVLTGAVGERFDRLAEVYLKAHPGRFQLYAGVLRENVDAPDYPQRAAAEVERCYQKGARGLGELSDKGLGYQRDPSIPRDKRLHPDDPRLDLFWKKAAELKLPANIHMADHPSAWRPPDNRQERSPNFQVYNQYRKDVPSYEEILKIRDRLLSRHPKNTFIAAHLGNQGNDLASLSKVMDRFPNLYLDISARKYELGRQPRQAVKFLKKYKDRILFGTDQGRKQDMYMRWWRFLESPDEYMPSQSWWPIYGLKLSEPVLKALYRDNAKRILNWD
jgi:predicted TIM-barrel fold metal-dependent hydrolase